MNTLPAGWVHAWNYGLPQDPKLSSKVANTGASGCAAGANMCAAIVNLACSQWTNHDGNV